MKIVWIVLAVLAAIVVIAWIGLKINAAPFPAFPQKSGEVKTVPLPAGLPAPVERFYKKIYGDQIPVIENVVMTGRAELRPMGPVTFNGRFRFTHDAGKGYRHYIEATWFGLPVMQVNERYLDGKGYGELPGGVVSQGKKVDQAANLGMWAELAWVPAVFLTDQRVQWQPLTDDSAILVVPFEDGQESFTVRFDPNTDLIKYMEVMRYRDESSKSKSLWITENLDFGEINGITTTRKGSATWFEMGQAWAIFKLEEMEINVDVEKSLRGRGLD